MIKKHLVTKLFDRPSPFITVATCSNEGEPNAAPKLLFKYSRGHLYLVDVPHGQTWQNLKENPRFSMSFVDREKLKAYRFKGTIEILDSKKHQKKHYAEIDKLLNKMIVSRIIEGSSRGKAYGNYIATVPKDFIVFKARVLEIVEYGLEDIKTRKSTKKVTLLP